MAANWLPDELISRILVPLLHVPDDILSTLISIAGVSPFLTFSLAEPSSTYLTVSKSWLRVGTPLLYNVVVIRSKAQAQALAATLTANSDLGRLIKKLRVEGGYDLFMHTIIERAPNVADLFISLQLDQADYASGLCLGLPLLNPVRVTVDAFSEVYANGVKFLEVLQACILGQWTRLTRLEMPLDFAQQNLQEAISKAALLETLVVWSWTDWLHTLAQYIRAVSGNPSLKKIQVMRGSQEPWHPSLRQDMYEVFKSNSRMLSMLFLGRERILIETPEIPFVYPLRLAADTLQEDAIWDRILAFVLRSDVPEIEEAGAGLLGHGNGAQTSRLSPLLVCKLFARLGRKHLYAITVLKNENNAQSLESELERHPELGLHVQILCMNFYSDSSILWNLVVHMPALTELHGRYASWKVFRNFSVVAGRRLRVLQGLEVSRITGTANPDTLTLFPQIVRLHWNSKTKFNSAPELLHWTTFNNLVNLTVTEFHESFFTVLAHADLPSLRSVFFTSLTAYGGASFFRKHGSKLQEVQLSQQQITAPKLAIWRNCPSVTTLNILFDEYHPVTDRCLVASEILLRLECIQFKVLGHFA
ncbi:hypothetical protein R3P38DRAFT_2876184 [Favolaschia claudopus]|uniref:F-box domain-containing protein n=1 Tax=Favolaschia claudopus TaxID=2862362 RepID=A0AAW0D5Z1_9AGAR